MLDAWRKLRNRGVLGINARNGDYLALFNQRRRFPLVDDKLKTKDLAARAGILVPELYELIEAPFQLRSLHAKLARYSAFALKPSRGSGGEGILILRNLGQAKYRKNNGVELSAAHLDHHICNILGGLYSLGGHPDRAMFEYCVEFDPRFERICYGGVPDVRIIVFLGFPVMAMMRLPTRLSDGKANLHQGAVGAGIRIRSGATCAAVWRNRSVTTHPETGADVIGVQFPEWERLLRLAASCFELCELGLIGVDIVLDRQRGPMLLEINARPGLNVQIANQAGLAPRLQKVQRDFCAGLTPEERVTLAQEQEW